MANDLAPVSLEQVQAKAISAETERQMNMDNVTIFIAKIEDQLRQAEKVLTDAIPVLQKAVNAARNKLEIANKKDADEAGKKVEKDFQDVTAFLAKKKFRKVSVIAMVDSDAQSPKHRIKVCLQQAGDSYRAIWLGNGENSKPEVLEFKKSKAVIVLQEDLKSLQTQLTDTQKKLLEVKCQAQDISMHERRGKAFVIRSERMLTDDGKRMVRAVEDAAESNVLGFTKYAENLTKSLKALPGSK